MGHAQEAQAAASLWLASAPATGYPALAGDVEADVAVVGGGIAGLTAALELRRRGLAVVLLEAARVGTGVSGNTTGKVTSLHRLAYTGLAAAHGLDAARAYGEANEAAIEHIAATVQAEGIDCGFRRVANYTWAEGEEALARVRAEAELAQELGLPASYTTEVPLPFPAKGAVRFDRQAQVHAVRYLQGLARALDGAGGAVFEQSRVRAIRDGAPVLVETEGGRVRARDVVVATNLPIGDHGRFARLCRLHRSYVVASPTAALGGDATFISADEPMRSILGTRIDGTDYILVGGEGHPVPGGGAPGERFGRLATYARERLGAGEPAYQWSTQDCMPSDGLPYAGPIAPGARHIHVITGLRKWGLTNGTAAALVVADAVSGLRSPWAGLFDSTRDAPPVPRREDGAAEDRAAEAAPRGRGPSAAGAPQLGPGQGAVLDLDGEPAAVYADPAGALHALSAACTHLGCTVEFNPDQATWDCPCHGSRFSLEGSPIRGPATTPLRQRTLPEARPAPEAG
ncbi:iron-sulfur-binding protein [Sinomonas atrocyanea]|uniref:FAD-dependent oxidoreductase n=1 Tax=Sinomonas atrocyanea TaxID=37927 RepID=UPI0011447C28|nr:FAD-dependent oxidoreductase [Sinomonas atrocyanea]GEB66498.1 iron-sulfur-binding protein [Sinomonas atrocyanea]GGG80613.1 iron-sulfur-binding protein [Sinomonas atrocyanea]